MASYLGADQESWKTYDSCELIRQSADDLRLPILIDQGENDDFLDEQLKPLNLLEAAKESTYPVQLRMQQGYDHSYFFIASFIDDHLRFHAAALSD